MAVPLLKAHPHKWGPGKVHRFNRQHNRTFCGKAPKDCPGDMLEGNPEMADCKVCREVLERARLRALRFGDWSRPPPPPPPATSWAPRIHPDSHRPQPFLVPAIARDEQEVMQREEAAEVHDTDNHRLGLGKWSQRGVPHKGWTCVGMEDLGDLVGVCEMCETTAIRYVHHMEHPDYPDVLGCGCICAGHMAQDKLAAESRERVTVNRANRRKHFLDRVTWKISAKGNPHIKLDGYHVVVYPARSGFNIFITDPRQKTFANKVAYPTMQRAQLAAFDAVMFLQDSQREGVRA